jgi:hypothetical protein
MSILLRSESGRATRAVAIAVSRNGPRHAILRRNGVGIGKADFTGALG